MNKKKVLLAFSVTAVMCASVFGVTACEQHTHDWNGWTVTAENAPSKDGAGKAERTCNGCDEVGELTLPALGNGAYTVTDDTATCEGAGTATYSYEKDGDKVAFTASSPAKGHAYGETYVSAGKDGHYKVCANDNSHHTRTENHGLTPSADYKLKYNSATDKYEHIYQNSCGDCAYFEDKKGAEEDLSVGGTLDGAASGAGTYANPFIISGLSSVAEYTATIPANTVMPVRFTAPVITTVAVMVTSGDNAAVVFDGTLTPVADGGRGKKQFIGGMGAVLDFALTTSDGQAGEFTFKFIDNEEYSVAGNPRDIELDTEYTAEAPAETWVSYNFTPSRSGWYKFKTQTPNGVILIERGRMTMLGYGNEIEEKFEADAVYTVRVSSEDKSALTVKFSGEFVKDLEEPLEGSKEKPYAITEAKEYEVEIAKGKIYAITQNYAFTPSASGLYKFYDESTADAMYALYSDSAFNTMLTSSLNFAGQQTYSYAEAELTAGTTYYLSVGLTSKNENRTLNMNIELHTHTFKTGTEWSTDEIFHWYASTCGHDLTASKALHNFEDGVCTACGATTNTQKTLDISVDGEYAIVNGFGEAAGESVLRIPAEYEGKPVTKIAANAFNDSTNGPLVTTVFIPETITEIGAGAFGNCTNLNSVMVTDINKYAQITFGNVTSAPCSAGKASFYLNGQLITDLTLTVSVSHFAFNNAKELKKVTLDGEVKVGQEAFKGSSITELETKNGDVKLGYVEGSTNYGYSFANCAYLTTVRLGEGITNIAGQYVFSDCNNLKNVYLPESFASVTGQYVFGKSNYIENVYIKSLEKYWAITWKSGYGGNILSQNKDVGNLYINGVLLEEVNFADYTVTNIDFQYITSIKKVNFTGMTAASYNLSGCTGIKELRIDTIEHWYELSSAGTTPLVTAEGSKLYIGDSQTPFKLQSLEITENINVYTYAGLEIGTVTVKDTVTSIMKAFRNAKIDNLVIEGTGVMTINSKTSAGYKGFQTAVVGNVFFKGTAEEYTASKWTHSNLLGTATVGNVYYYSETQPTEAGNFWHFVGNVATVWE